MGLLEGDWLVGLVKGDWLVELMEGDWLVGLTADWLLAEACGRGPVLASLFPLPCPEPSPP